ncbi:MAG: TonB-dependent receptor [Wenzhouxiangella sp.]
MQLDRSHLAIGLFYAALGMGLGIFMAATRDHGQMVAHAHLLLAGFLLSVIYAIIHRLWLSRPNRKMAVIQFVLHHAGVVAMVSGLFLLYGGHASHDSLEPLLAGSSVLILLALLLMLSMVLAGRRSEASVRAQAEAA